MTIGDSHPGVRKVAARSIGGLLGYTVALYPFDWRKAINGEESYTHTGLKVTSLFKEGERLLVTITETDNIEPCLYRTSGKYITPTGWNTEDQLYLGVRVEKPVMHKSLTWLIQSSWSEKPEDILKIFAISLWEIDEVKELYNKARQRGFEFECRLENCLVTRNFFILFKLSNPHTNNSVSYGHVYLRDKLFGEALNDVYARFPTTYRNLYSELKTKDLKYAFNSATTPDRENIFDEY